MVGKKVTAENSKEMAQLIKTLATDIWHEYYIDMITDAQIDYMLGWMYSSKMIEKEVEQGTQWTVYYENDQPIGYTAITQEEKILQLNKIYLKPEFHSTGRGQQMMNDIIAYAADKEISSIFLTVNKENDKAQRFYVKNGFEKEDAVSVDIGSGFIMDDFVYRKKLKQ